MRHQGHTFRPFVDAGAKSPPLDWFFGAATRVIRAATLGVMSRRGAAALALALLLPMAGNASADPDLPGATPNFETIEAGALVIPMDNTNQAVVAPFNLKAYGLVNNLLQNNIPVKWAIRAGKAKDGTDFTADVQRILPAPALAPALGVNFSGGPFIVAKQYAAQAQTLATAFGNSVAVFKTTADVSVDVRYTLTFKPFVAISNVNTQIHIDLMVAAGIPGPAACNPAVDPVPASCVCTPGLTCNWSAVNPIALTAQSCATIHIEPHRNANDATNAANRVAVGNFLAGGGNFLAQCQAVSAFEKLYSAATPVTGTYLTSAGVVIDNIGDALTFPFPDTPFSQIVGALNPATGGSEQDFTTGTGAFTNNGHMEAQDSVETDHFAAAAGKVKSGLGGNVYYLGGHQYTTASIADLNGMRMALNALFVPASRPAVCGFDFAPDLAITKTDGKTTAVAGTANTYTIVVTNTGSVAATGATVVDLFPAAFTGVTYTAVATGGATGFSASGSGNINDVVNMPVGSTITYTATGTIDPGATGTLTNTATVTLAGLTDPTPGDNTATDVTTLTAEADLTITKSVDNPTPSVGGNVTFTITVTNTGPSTATGVAVADLLPSGYAFVSATPSTGGYVAGTGVWTIGTMTNGAVATLQLTATVLASGSYANTAVATSTTFDPTTPNTATATPTPVPRPPVIVPTQIPTMGEYGLLALMLLLAAMGGIHARRSRR